MQQKKHLCVKLEGREEEKEKVLPSSKEAKGGAFIFFPAPEK